MDGTAGTEFAAYSASGEYDVWLTHVYSMAGYFGLSSIVEGYIGQAGGALGFDNACWCLETPKQGNEAGFLADPERMQ